MITKLRIRLLRISLHPIVLAVVVPAAAQHPLDNGAAEAPIHEAKAAAATSDAASPAAPGRCFYVRQTVGDDGNDGRSPQTAWRTVGKLSLAMHAGDTAYVGPGLYREQIAVINNASEDRPMTFIADASGAHTGDPAGVVMITGADPVDEEIFEYDSTKKIYKAAFPAERRPLLGCVEMDGDQRRYYKITKTKEFRVENMSAQDAVASLPSTFHWDEESKILYIHTSDGKHPRDHELEVIRRLNGISAVNKPYIRVIGFMFRHQGDSGISFLNGSDHCTAIGNTVYGSRQGIRIRAAPHTSLYHNTCFRNENSGVYAFYHSTNTVTVGNVCYDNVKGIRYGSGAMNGIALDNVVFENRECGLSIEEADGVLLRGNRIVGNQRTQISVLRSRFMSDHNCFEITDRSQSAAYLSYPLRSGVGWMTLAEYRQQALQDRSSIDGNCGALPEKLDVHQLHTDTSTYAARARRILEQANKARPANEPADHNTD